MKDILTFIKEGSRSWPYRAYSTSSSKNKDRKLNVKPYLDEKIDNLYRRALQDLEDLNVNGFITKYPNKDEENKAKENFIKQLDGKLIYNHNKIQIEIFGEYRCTGYYPCWYNKGSYTGFSKRFEREGTFNVNSNALEYLNNNMPSIDEIGDELGYDFKYDKSELDVENIFLYYPTIKIYYNYNSTPLIEIDGFKVIGISTDNMLGEIGYKNVIIDKKTIELRNALINIIRKGIASTINYGFGSKLIINVKDDIKDMYGEELIKYCTK